jgi:hypothetical protein
MLVFLRLTLLASIRGFEPCKSCFVLKPATIMSRNRESIPGHVPSFATPVKPLPLAFSEPGNACSVFKTVDFCAMLSSELVFHFVYMNFISIMSAGSARTAITTNCNQLIADLLQLGQRIFHNRNIVPQ